MFCLFLKKKIGESFFQMVKNNQNFATKIFCQRKHVNILGICGQKTKGLVLQTGNFA